MMNIDKERDLCIYVTGLSPDTERSTLYKEFNKFGTITKLYLEQLGKTFAKVYYTDKKSCDLAVAELNKTALNWKVVHGVPPQNSVFFKKRLSSNSSNMASYNDFYDEDFSENYDYCNVHGQPLLVLQADSGDLFINLKDIRNTGFALFRRDTFDSVLVDKRQINKEFDLHLLSEAKNYILKNKVAVIDEEQILKTIERCKNKLLGESTSNDNKYNFGDGRSVAQSPGNKIVITSETLPSLNKDVSDSPYLPRAPKTLPEKFMPTNTQRISQEHKKQEDKASRNKHDSFNQDDRQSNDSSDFSDKGGKKTNGYRTPNQNRHQTKNEIQNQKFSPDNKIRSRLSDEPQKETNTNKSSPKGNDIESTIFEIGNTYTVQGVYQEKESVYWVQQISDVSVLEDMFLQINEMESSLDCVDPERDQVVVASFEGAWNRGRILSIRPLKVHFIDYGNKNEVDLVKALPDCFKRIPALAVRVAVNKNADVNLSENINIKVKQQYDDGTYLVTVFDQNSKKTHTKSNIPEPTSLPKPKAATPLAKSYFRSSLSERTLKNGDMVIIADIDENKFLLKTKECVHRSKEIVEHIKHLYKADLTLTNVKEDQIVLCAKDGLIGLFRAVVTKIEGSVVLVRYIDVSGEDSLALKCLQNVDDFLASEAPCLITSPEYELLSDANNNILEYLTEVIEKKEKFTVVFGDEFDLINGDTAKLSEVLLKLKNPIKAVSTPSIPSTSTSTSQLNKNETKPEVKVDSANKKVLYDEMDWIQVEPGPHTCMCYGFKDLNDFTVILATDETVTHIEKISTLEVQDNVPYKPEELEMCLATFIGPDDEEANWYRAAVLKTDGDDYIVSFVDFGNQEVIKFEDIRKFPADLKEIPVLGMSCEFTGLPDKPEIVNRLKELLPDGEQLEINIKGTNDLKYQIEIPTIYKKLKSEGLY